MKTFSATFTAAGYVGCLQQHERDGGAVTAESRWLMGRIGLGDETIGTVHDLSHNS